MRDRRKDILSGENGVSRDSEVGEKDQNTG